MESQWKANKANRRPIESYPETQNLIFELLSFKFRIRNSQLNT